MNGILAVNKGTVTQSLYDLHFMYQCFSYEYFCFFEQKVLFSRSEFNFDLTLLLTIINLQFLFLKMISTKY